MYYDLLQLFWLLKVCMDGYFLEGNIKKHGIKKRKLEWKKPAKFNKYYTYIFIVTNKIDFKITNLIQKIVMLLLPSSSVFINWQLQDFT